MNLATTKTTKDAKAKRAMSLCLCGLCQWMSLNAEAN
jgi:hypothetical protein